MPVGPVPSDRTESPLASPATRHSALVRATHWLYVLAFFLLLISGAEIVISHPRFYWGENGNVLTPALFQLPIPASRSLVVTGYGYVLPDQNGWSRAMHFEAAWLAVFTGLVYLVAGFRSGHFRRDLWLHAGERSWAALRQSIVSHLRFERAPTGELEAYNLLQRLTYLIVIFAVFPMIVWTGLAMSPAFTAAYPAVVTLLGGRQTARTLHFFLATTLFAFLLVHVGMVWFVGFRRLTRAMITGRLDATREGA